MSSSHFDQFRRELAALSGVLGKACENLAGAILKHVFGSRGREDVEAVNAADKLNSLAEMLRHLDEGGGFCQK
jgi:glutathione synthase/RimK-type ligase-like ATP-grasp enzyme